MASSKKTVPSGAFNNASVEAEMDIVEEYEPESERLAEIRMLREHIEQLEKTIQELRSASENAPQAPVPATSPHEQR